MVKIAFEFMLHSCPRKHVQNIINPLLSIQFKLKEELDLDMILKFLWLSCLVFDPFDFHSFE